MLRLNILSHILRRPSAGVRHAAVLPWMLVSLQACVFFDTSYDQCVDQGSCATGGADSTLTGELGSGGIIERATGGAASGGAVSSGGAESGGSSSSGGASSGGSGGSSSGGSGAGPSIMINELMRSHFVELYVSSGSANLKNYALAGGDVIGPNYATQCSLEAAGTLSAGEFLEVSMTASCLGGGACVAITSGCTFAFDVGDVVYLVRTGSSSEIVDSRQYPEAGAPLVGQSYAATSDGGSMFLNGSPTPGATNTP